MSEASITVPLFPLRTVLFPGGLLPLQIFEPRYVDMIKRCMREDLPFGVLYLVEGREADDGTQAESTQVAELGTLAYIVDFTQLPNGLLGITARGDRRFRVQNTWREPDNLLMGEVGCLEEQPAATVPEEYETLVDILRQLVEHPAVNRLGLDVDFGDAHSVSGRLADLLPMDVRIKQHILEIDDPLTRLAEVERVVHAMRQEAESE